MKSRLTLRRASIARGSKRLRFDILMCQDETVKECSLMSVHIHQRLTQSISIT
jgi:hypothetical protein